MDGFHWIYRSILKKTYDELQDPLEIANNEDLYNFSEKYIEKTHKTVNFEFCFKNIEKAEMQGSEKQYKLVEKNSKLPLSYRKRDGMSKTLHLLEAIVSLKFRNGSVSASTVYEHETPDIWELLDSAVLQSAVDSE